MTINLFVRGQHLTLGKCAPFVVSDTINYIAMQAAFMSPDWEGLVKWAHVAQGDKVYDVLLDDDGRIGQDAGLNLGAGVWQIYLHGNRVEGGETTQRITTNSVAITVTKSGLLNGEPLPPVPPTAAEQILATAEEAKRIAQSVRDDADAGAFDGEQGPQGEQGPKGDKGDTGPGWTPQQQAALDAYLRSLREENRIQDEIANYTYRGTDLTVKFAEEIADYANPWSWIKARIAAGNFTGLHVGDYIPFTTTNSRRFAAQIAGINTYKGYGGKEIGNQIDFITIELWPDTFEMNKVKINNGTSAEKSVPWLASNGYLFVNSLAGQVVGSTTKPYEMVDVDYTAGGMYFYLPDELKDVIVEKRVFAPTRYSESGVLNNDNNGAWADMGKLWLPDEVEITGARLMTTTGWFSSGFVQYPIFAHSMNRIKRVQGSNNRGSWWTSSANTGSHTGFVSVNFDAVVYSNGAPNTFRAPFCFRIA